MASDPSIEALLRRASDRAGLRDLLRGLGFPSSDDVPYATALFPGHAADAGSAPAERATVVAVAERGGVRGVALQVPGEVGPREATRLARRLRACEPGRPHLLVLADDAYRRLAFVAVGLDDAPRPLLVERARPRRSDLEALEELSAREGEAGASLALRHARALERSRVSSRFFRDFRARRDAVAAAWTGVPAEEHTHRDQLALLFLCRLMFLYFLQKDGHLAGDEAYLPRLVARGAPAGAGASLFRSLLQPLFFGALNTRPERREAAARALGELPYLNGGLFDRHPLERAHPDLDLPDEAVVEAVERLLERYRFTTRERAEADGGGAGLPGIDPEMLGRVFEGLMAADRRGATGTFYTPAPVVERLTREATATYLAGRCGLPAARARELAEGNAGAIPTGHRDRLIEVVRALRVLDPACGSGAFLVGALGRLAAVRRALGETDAVGARRDIVGRALHGVDLQEDAALLCALRLWLALAVRPGVDQRIAGSVAPLPNLDRRIRQGDALVDPLDLLGATAGTRAGGADVSVRQAVRRIEPLARRYLGADPHERPGLQRELVAAEAALGAAWLASTDRRLEWQGRELAAQADGRDLFGERPSDAARAEAERLRVERTRCEVARLREELEQGSGLPFFSFGVHFAEAAVEGFDLILSNPPWVRSHRWPAHLRRLVGRRYRVCGAAGWRAKGAAGPRASGAQVDLALLFLERSIELLAPGGVLGMILPAKVLRSLFGAGGRRLLTEQARLVSLQDCSLDQRSVFQADAFAALVVAEKRRGPAMPDERVRVTMIRRRAESLRFTLPTSDLPLVAGDADSPWLIVPPEVRGALRRMQATAPPLGAGSGVRIRRGVVTGANDVLVIREAEDKLGGLAVIRAEGAFSGASAPDRRPGPAPDGSRSASGGQAPAERYEAVVESSGLARLVRGRGIGAWRFDARERLVWVHDDGSGEPGPPPRRLAAYLDRHATRLEARSGSAPGLPPGALFHVTRDTLRPKVAWHDLAETLNAVALPARIGAGAGRPLVPLNTVYFAPVDSEDEALLLAAYLNALPLRTFARAIAERAKDARFRFFAWVIAALPFPAGWRADRHAPALLALSRDAHEAGRIEPEAQARLDDVVGRALALGPADMAALARFDRWLRGEG